MKRLWIDPKTVDAIAATDPGQSGKRADVVAVVNGGGNIRRGLPSIQRDDRATVIIWGMLATVINSPRHCRMPWKPWGAHPGTDAHEMRAIAGTLYPRRSGLPSERAVV